MAGAEFVRADLHVHTFRDGDDSPAPRLEDYVATALQRGVQILGITDHNTSAFVKPAMRAAEGTGLFVVPGVEVSTHDGHLLALFSPDSVDELEAFVVGLELKDLPGAGKRSIRAMLHLVDEVATRGGLAIPAHIDAADGIQGRLGPAELTELLSHPGLAGLEFRDRIALETWFTDDDVDAARVAAWKARQSVNALQERGLARLMSSDAHSTAKLGMDQATRTLTRLRMDHLNFEALRNAIVNNPKARCKAEVVLPASYPHITKAEFHGGFLDGVTLDFSPNLNCLIGGRGSGKSTALLAITAALGASESGETVDEVERMPDVTRVHFVDSTGSARIAVRNRGEAPKDEASGSPIRLRLADLAQEESAQLARESVDHPDLLLAFLDTFVNKHKHDEEEADVMAALAENGTEVQRTAVAASKLKEVEEEQARLEANLAAAQSGQIEEIAKWASLLAAQEPLLARLEADITSSVSLDEKPRIDLDALGVAYGVDLTSARAVKFVDGDGGLRETLSTYETKRREYRSVAEKSIEEAAAPSRAALAKWQADQADLLCRLEAKQKELEAKGLKVQAGAVREIADRLNEIKKLLGALRERTVEHKTARMRRDELLTRLHDNRQSLCAARRATIGQIVAAANRQSDGRLALRVAFDEGGIDDPWVQWLTATFGFRSPRVQRVAAAISAREFARALLTDVPKLLSLSDTNGNFFSQETLKPLYRWDILFELETMRLEDKPRIEVRESRGAEWRPFAKLSAGQQHSVFLSLLLCAQRYEPLVLDQPEDHLDPQYIASGVVRHLEGAKESRQLIIATHSANLTVLGDAELVIPMRVEGGKGRPEHEGAIDRPSTRARVCDLLEGGVDAYERRGGKYGFLFAGRPPPPDDA
jgi:ABC-type lipoprotein export system ATPase subunit